MIYTYLFALTTLVILVGGLILMGLGGKLNKKFGTRLMTLRVVFQALTIAALAMLYFLTK